MSEAPRTLAELAREGLEAYERGDIETVLALLRPDIEVSVSPVMPNPENVRSHEDFLTWVGRWEEAWGSFTSEILSLEAVDDDHVIAHTHQRGTGAASGVEVEMDVFWMFEWDGAKASRIGLYVSREEALAAARGEGAAP